jgi:GT2 family glycosyltransferase
VVSTEPRPVRFGARARARAKQRPSPPGRVRSGCTSRLSEDSCARPDSLKPFRVACSRPSGVDSTRSLASLDTSSSMQSSPVVSFVISAKNRPDSLERCLASIRSQETPGSEVIVDDGSARPLPNLWTDILLARNEWSTGMCAARNRGARLARGKYLVVIDDDAEFATPGEISRALELIAALPRCAAMGFRQVRPTGAEHYVQPADSRVNCLTNRFYGHGFLFRREIFLQLGGFAEPYGYYQEEIEVCLRLLSRGFTIVFASDVKVIHHEDPRGRNLTGIARRSLRNGMLTACLTYPLWAIPLGLARACWNSLRSSYALIGLDPLGKWLAFKELLRLRNFIRGRRDPVGWDVLMQFRKLGRSYPPITL